MPVHNPLSPIPPAVAEELDAWKDGRREPIAPCPHAQEPPPWNQREAFVRLCELAIERCREDLLGWAGDLSNKASYGSNDEECFRGALAAAAFDPAHIDLEVAIVRQRAERPTLVTEELDLDVIEAGVAELAGRRDRGEWLSAAAFGYLTHIPRLVAEVRKLRGELTYFIQSVVREPQVGDIVRRILDGVDGSVAQVGVPDPVCGIAAVAVSRGTSTIWTPLVGFAERWIWLDVRPPRAAEPAGRTRVDSAIELLRGAFRDDGAEGESVHLLCREVEHMTADLVRAHETLDSVTAGMERTARRNAQLHGVLSGLRDIATGKIAHVYAGTCPNIAREGNDTEHDRADPFDDCPACDVLRRVDALLDDAACEAPVAAPAWTPPPGTAVEVLRGSMAGPFLVALVTIEPGAEWPREVHAEHEENVVWLSGLLHVSIGAPPTALARVLDGGCVLAFVPDRMTHVIRAALTDEPATYISILRRVAPTGAP